MEMKKWTCEIKLSTKNCRHWPADWYAECHSSGAITGMEGTCWSHTIWSQMSQYRCIINKNVMDPWQAPYPNSNDYWCSTCDQKRSGRNFHQTSVNFTVSTHCYTKGPYKEGTLTDKCKVLLPLPSNTVSFLRWRISPFKDVSHTCVNRQ
jgi:hypothetical protein